MSRQDVYAILVRLGAFVVDDHFVYASGQHGSVYVNKDAVTPHVSDLWDLAQEIAAVSARHGLEVIVGPAEGSITLAGFVALALSADEHRHVLGPWASKQPDGGFNFRSTFLEMIAGKRVMVVEDILTTGKSARKVVEAVRGAGGIVEMVSALCNRGGVTAADLDVNRLYSLLDFPAKAWPAAECPLCEAGVPINQKLGHGKQFLQEGTIGL